MRTSERRQPSAPPPREQVLREAPFQLRSAADAEGENDGFTLDGWGAVFNRETVIDSWEGKFRETIKPGSMKKSFRENPPRIQYDHGHHPLIGTLPIASLRSIVEETDPEFAPEGGAHVIGRLFDNWLVQPVREAMEAGDINGMSFRFSVVRDAWFTAEGKQVKDDDELFDMLSRTWFGDVPDEELLLRELRELRVPEIGPVFWPAYEETSVAVRSQVIDLGRLTDPRQRELLAKAVLIADAAARTQDEPEPTATAGNHTSSSAPVTTSNEAGDHAPETSTDAPRSTDAPSAGEHESNPARGMRPIDLWVRKARDTVLSAEKKGRSRA